MKWENLKAVFVSFMVMMLLIGAGRVMDWYSEQRRDEGYQLVESSQRVIDRAMKYGAPAENEELTKQEVVLCCLYAFFYVNQEQVPEHDQAGSWCDEWLQYAWEKGIITEPLQNRSVQRQEAFTILARIFHFKEQGGASLWSFQDGSTVDGWARESTLALIELDIVVGEGGSLFPKRAMKRSDFKPLLERALRTYMKEREKPLLDRIGEFFQIPIVSAIQTLLAWGSLIVFFYECVKTFMQWLRSRKNA